MKIQEFPKKMYAGLFVVLLMFAVSCDGVISNIDDASKSPSMSYNTIDGLNFGEWGEEDHEVCETAFAFGGEFGNCFLDNEMLNANRWGWSNGPLGEGYYEFPIYTGAAQCDITKGTEVGTLKVTYAEGDVTVTYELFEGFYMTEVHIYVGNDEIPKDRRGRYTVAPGQYTFTNDMLDNVSNFSETFEGFEGDIFIIAHAVVCEGCVPLNVIYGTVGDGKNGSLWQITVSGGTIIEETELISFPLTGDGFSPNGLALDKENNRLYFAVNNPNPSTNADLYFYDFGGDDPDVNIHPVAPGGLRGKIYAATWGAGLYWYIPNQSSDMRTVDVTTGVASDFELNFTGTNRSFNFGDMALDVENLTIYSSTSFSGTHKEFFKYDLTITAIDPGDRYTRIVEYEGVPTNDAGKAIGLQLAFDAEGNLFGHSTFGQTQTGAAAREFFLVNKEMGLVNSLPYISENQYNDLASGRFIFLCKETEENEY